MISFPYVHVGAAAARGTIFGDDHDKISITRCALLFSLFIVSRRHRSSNPAPRWSELRYTALDGNELLGGASSKEVLRM